MLLVELFLMWVGCWVGDRSSGVFKRRGIGSAHQSSPSLLTIGQWNVTSGSPISSSKKRWGYGGGRERETHREREKERECVCMWVLLLKIKKVFSCSTKQDLICSDFFATTVLWFVIFFCSSVVVFIPGAGVHVQVQNSIQYFYILFYFSHVLIAVAFLTYKM